MKVYKGFERGGLGRRFVRSKLEILLAEGTSSRSLYVIRRTGAGVNADTVKTLHDFSLQETPTVLFILGRSVAG
jgi:hypothetical protein